MCGYLNICHCVCAFTWVCVCVLTVPSQPQDIEYEISTDSTMELLWKQPGVVDYYRVKYNNTETSNFIVFNENSESSAVVRLTVKGLPTSGAYYCISVTAVSGHLHSVGAMLCDYTGDDICCKPFLLSSHCFSIGIPFNRAPFPLLLLFMF